MSAKDSKAATRFVCEVALAYGSDLHRFLVKRMRANEDAEDVAQEVYLRLLRLERSDLIRQPHAYVYYIAAQIAGERRMRAAQQSIVYDSAMAERVANEAAHAWPDELPEQLHVERELKRLLARLSTVHRNVLILRKRDGLSIPEIAQELGISVHKVRRYLVEANERMVSFKWERS
jgi:RNA polymerase sigma-19 factor, ECF subfamily